ncbi:MAG: YbhB/YbcL family Raf kinase inhibitor-like protein [Candidatus Obscuribacter sp.]|nr:YbhB/YbcL family Raf kinase inhibitor-like protein [Candidatus Obscuribacter sp.]
MKKQLVPLISLGLALSFASGVRAAKMDKLSLETSAFKAGAAIPTRFTGDGADLSPELRWSAVPKGTVSIAVSCEDPDAPRGTWWHWILYNLPPSTQSLKEGLEKSGNLASGAMQGLNDFDKSGYNGPSPPPGSTHRYFFRVYALDSKLNLPAGAKKEAFSKALAGHILAFGEVMGTYKR